MCDGDGDGDGDLDPHLLDECACEPLESGLRTDFLLGLRELSRAFDRGVSRAFDVRILPIFTWEQPRHQV